MKTLRKSLSVVLVLAVMMSLIAVSFAGTASAAGTYCGENTTVVSFDDEVSFKAVSTALTTETGVTDGDRTVMKTVATAAASTAILSTIDIELGKKYYVSFDAKAEAIGTYVAVGYANNLNKRSFISGNYGTSVLATRYVNGTQLGNANTACSPTKNTFTTSDTNWNTYSIVFSPSVNNYTSADHFNDGVQLFLGSSAGTVYFDNLVVCEFAEVALNNAPADSVNKSYHSIRAEDAEADEYVSAGLRFRANLSKTNHLSGASDYGFVVAPTALVKDDDTAWYDLQGSGSACAQSVSCKDKVYSEEQYSKNYQLILKGLTRDGVEANMLDTQFSVVFYLVKDGNYSYLNVSTMSYYEVKANYMLYDSNYWTEF